MSSASIYTPIKPTYLYIKQHSVTGLKYFGKTTQNPYQYLGSGSYWKKHIKKHGKEFVKTIWVSDLYTDTSIVEIALHFSNENNIVESNDWANFILENGLDGGDTFSGKTHTKESKAKMSAGNKGKIPWSKGKLATKEHKFNMSIGMKGKNVGKIPWNKGIQQIQSLVTCPRCNKTGGASNMKRYHFDNCKSK
jgi:hypothetical protein